MVLRLDSELSAAMGAGCELRYHDYLVLVVLTDQDDGRVRPIRLRELLGWEKSTLTRQIDRMERRGLVIRERCESDRRGSVVAVTEAGREAIAREAPRHVRAVREYFVDRLTSSQLESLYEIARAVSGDDNAWSQADNGECSQT
jgi:DNA-binding MarR family transcriptional regulator